jgi:hypothetical protein
LLLLGRLWRVLNVIAVAWAVEGEVVHSELMGF